MRKLTSLPGVSCFRFLLFLCFCLSLSFSLCFVFFLFLAFLSAFLSRGSAVSPCLCSVSFRPYCMEAPSQQGQQHRHPGQPIGGKLGMVRFQSSPCRCTQAANHQDEPKVRRMISADVTHPLPRSCLQPLLPIIPLGAALQLYVNLHAKVQVSSLLHQE